MNTKTPYPLLLLCLGVAVSMITVSNAEEPDLVFEPRLASYIAARLAEYDRIPPDRQQSLERLATYVRQRGTQHQPINLTFICTHNSRRSHIAQLWAAVAAAYYGIDGVHTFSGGTESTAFNPRAVAALQRAGFAIDRRTAGDNPHYRVVFAAGAESLDCFSKVYDAEPNPHTDFCAVLTCSEADRNCPMVQGAALRLAIPYDDPKLADNTPTESTVYDERCAQIAREMLYVFSRCS